MYVRAHSHIYVWHDSEIFCSMWTLEHRARSLFGFYLHYIARYYCLLNMFFSYEFEVMPHSYQIYQTNIPNMRYFLLIGSVIICVCSCSSCNWLQGEKLHKLKIKLEINFVWSRLQLEFNANIINQTNWHDLFFFSLYQNSLRSPFLRRSDFFFLNSGHNKVG